MHLLNCNLSDLNSAYCRCGLHYCKYQGYGAGGTGQYKGYVAGGDCYKIKCKSLDLSK